MHATLFLVPLTLGLIALEPARDTVKVEEVRVVVAAIVKAAEENAARKGEALAGDALADHYLRRAAAVTVAEKLSPAAVLVGLGVAMDDTDLLRKNIVFGGFLGQVENDRERARRLRVIAQPSLRGRHDWLLHFAVSAGICAQLG